MTTELLGLEADGFERTLHVRRPMLPDGIDALSLRGLRMAGATVSLKFTRRPAVVKSEVIGGGDGSEILME